MMSPRGASTWIVRIDWSWPEQTSGAEPSFQLLQVPPKGLAAVVLKGPGPPPDHLDLLPGSYALVVEQDRVAPLAFEVEPGREVRLEAGPARR